MKIFSLSALLSALLFTVTGCSKKDSPDAEANSLTGKWVEQKTLIGFTYRYDNGDLVKRDTSLLPADASEEHFEFKADGSFGFYSVKLGVRSAGGNGTYTYDGSKLQLKFPVAGTAMATDDVLGRVRANVNQTDAGLSAYRTQFEKGPNLLLIFDYPTYPGYDNSQTPLYKYAAGTVLKPE